MTTYVVLLPGDEDSWESASEEHRSATYAKHGEFARLLAERGHTITGGAELAHSRDARVVRRAEGRDAAVTEGPYAETAEQLTGFYVVESSDLDDLIEICKGLGKGEQAIEIRACRPGSGD